jgi:Amt family ammonium transporter
MIVTFVILKVIDAIVGLRVDLEAEVGGLDLAEHSEAGYTM